MVRNKAYAIPLGNIDPERLVYFPLESKLATEKKASMINIFFTYDQNGDQFWTFGVPTRTGKSVTINTLYPAASTAWGRVYNAGNVD